MPLRTPGRTGDFGCRVVVHRITPAAVSAAISSSFRPRSCCEHLPRVLAEMRRAASRLDLQLIARERPARIGNRAADLRVLD